MKGKAMTTDNESTSNNSSSGGANTDPGGEGKNQQKNSVSYETYTKVLDEAKAAKAKLREFEENFNKTREEKLKADGDWKGLLETRESRIKELETELSKTSEKFSSLHDRITNSQKLAKVLSKVGGHVDEKYYGLIDISDVKTNPETGEIDDMSAAKVAESFRTTYSDVVKKGFNPASMGETKGAGNQPAATIPYEEWSRLPYNEKKKWRTSQIK
jgi:predicted RNase H-like nuclease (RuvC/YqgF family)